MDAKESSYMLKEHNGPEKEEEEDKVVNHISNNSNNPAPPHPSISTGMVTGNGFSDPEHQSMKKNNKRRCCICASVTAAVLVVLGLLMLILGLTVFKPKNAITTVDSVSVADLNFSFDATRLRVLVNLTLDLLVSVENPNRVGFKYTNSTAFLRYGGQDVGQAPVAAGQIGARDTRPMNLTLSLMADRLLYNSSFYSDVVMSKRLPLQSYVRLAGKVRLLFNFHVVTYATCDLVIHLNGTQSIDQSCSYKTKL